MDENKCSCEENCNEKEKEEIKVAKINAFPAKDPDGNPVAVFELEGICSKCNEVFKHQLIVNANTIFQFAVIFQQLAAKEMSTKNIITPEDLRQKKGGGIIIP